MFIFLYTCTCICYGYDSKYRYPEPPFNQPPQENLLIHSRQKAESGVAQYLSAEGSARPVL